MFLAWLGTALLMCALSSGEVLDAQDKQTSVPAASDEAYHIGVGDVVQIDVWKEPETTRTIQVRPDGKIPFPLLNDVQAAGLTPMQLAGSIREGLTKYFTNPQVTVTVTQNNSFQQVPPPNKFTPLQVAPQYKLSSPNGSPCDPEFKQKCCVA